MGNYEKKEPHRHGGWIAVLIAAMLLGGGAVWCFLRTATPAAEPEAPAPTQKTLTAVQAEPDRTVRLEATILEPEKPEPVRSSLRLMAVGDNLIHWSVYTSAKTEDGYDFSPFYRDIAQVAAEYDLACINQETIFINDPAEVTNYPVFGSPPEVGDALASAGFDVVTAATNHAYDKRETGIYDTVSFWRENYPEITMLGIHDSREDQEILHVVEKNGIRLALLNYTRDLNGFIASQPYFADLLTDREKILSDLARAEAEADFTVIFAHWGVEYQYLPDPGQTETAQFLADNGADLIIGTHPHVVEPVWITTASDGRQVPVFYSLGNFLSQQYHMTNHLGGMASVEIVKDETGVYVSEYELLPTVNVILHDPEGPLYSYRPMLLRDYTPELAAQHVIPGCTVEAMQAKFDEILSIPDPNTNDPDG